VTARVTPRIAVVPILGLLACAKVWGFQDLTEGPDGGSPDATTASDAQDDRSESALDAAVDAPGEEEDSASADALPDVRRPDGGEGGAAIAEGGVGDAGDDGAAAFCRSICGGCCDANNHCAGGDTTAACGTDGAACQTCSCTALQITCCVKGACKCEVSLTCL
jgi:hypothetical protein